MKLNNFNAELVAEYSALAYKLDENPLPHLRDIFSRLDSDVVVQYSLSSAFAIKKGKLCVTVHDIEEESEEYSKLITRRHAYVTILTPDEEILRSNNIKVSHEEFDIDEDEEVFLYWDIHYVSCEGNKRWVIAKTPNDWGTDTLIANIPLGGCGDDIAEIIEVFDTIDDNYSLDFT